MANNNNNNNKEEKKKKKKKKKKIKFTLEQVTKSQRGSSGMAVLFV